MSRAIRRHHYSRLKNARRYYWGRDLLGEQRRIGKCVSTPQACSCLSCGNERKHSGPPMQERRAALSEYEA